MPYEIMSISCRNKFLVLTRSGNHDMSNVNTTEFVIRMYAEQIAEGTFFSMVDLNDSTLNTRSNIESYFADVFFDTLSEEFGSPVESEIDEESFGSHVAGLVWDRIDIERFVGEVQARVNAMLVKQARAYSDLKMKELTNSDGSLKPIKLGLYEGSED
jgi:hypothetical protein